MTSFPGLQDYFEEDDVLFSDHPWAILKTDKMAGYMKQVAVIGHKCDSFDVVQFMDAEDSIRGECWWCKTSIPDHIQGLWQMMNWDRIPHMRVYDTDDELYDKNLGTRFKKSAPNVHGDGQMPTEYTRNRKKQTQVGHATALIHKTQTIIGRYSGR